MGYKSFEDRQACNARWYVKNRASVLENVARRNKEYKKRNQDYVWNYKSTHPCTDCGGFFHPVAMDFDHIADNKKNGIAILVAKGVSMAVLQQEMSKCEVVCANCHRVRTWNRSH